MRFHDSQVYTKIAQRLNAETAALEAELSGLVGVAPRERSATQRAQITKARAKLKTRASQLAKARWMSNLSWPDVVQLLMEVDGGLWTSDELSLLQLDVASFEGRGEKPIRHRLGYPLVATMGACDLPNDEEIKYVGNNIELIRVGKVGKRTYVRVLRELPDELITDEMLDGEVSAGKLFHTLPEPVRSKLQAELSPDRVLTSYSAIYVTTDEGFIRVPREDFASAWSLACVTQMSPKFKLKRGYVEDRLSASLSAEAEPTFVTVTHREPFSLTQSS